jgi:acyl-CoA synthetase (AMP-forming)/AMP-acid ligase II
MHAILLGMHYILCNNKRCAVPLSTGSPMPFQSPPFEKIRGLQTAKVFRSIAELNPDHTYGLILSDESSKISETITWKQFLDDAKLVASVLGQRLPSPTNDPLVIAVLATSGYVYAVHWLATLMNNWTVRIPSIVPYNPPEHFHSHYCCLPQMGQKG